MSESIRFTVLGHPAPQGSMKGFVVGGKARLTSDNSQTRPYRQEVGWAALRARPTDVLWAERGEPVAVRFTFYFGGPKKRRLCVTVKPDLDKLCRSTFDALTGVLWNDDAQVVSLAAEKHYGLPERVEIYVEKVA